MTVKEMGPRRGNAAGLFYSGLELMVLLDEIIHLLGDEKASLSGALLKTKILLHQIGQRDLVAWVNNELNGYPDGSELPEYRIIPSIVLANLESMTFRATAHPIPLMHLSESQRDSLQQSHMFQSLTVLEEMAAKSDGVQRHIPMELNPSLGKSLAKGIYINRAWCHVSSQDIKGIITQVRSRLLDFLLELKDTAGPAETASELKEKSGSLDAKSLFNNAIFGSNTTILIGHQSTIAATQTLNAIEFAQAVQRLVEQIERILPTSGLPPSVRTESETVLAELRSAASAPKPEPGRLRRGLDSLKHVMENAAGDLVATGVVTLITELVSHTAH